jgi:hypothetical protein
VNCHSNIQFFSFDCDFAILVFVYCLMSIVGVVLALKFVAEVATCAVAAGPPGPFCGESVLFEGAETDSLHIRCVLQNRLVFLSLMPTAIARGSGPGTQLTIRR